jgi:hypothetical protein
MIVLDEQLLGYGLQKAIAQWYPGPVVDITSLRPGSVIRDEAIPALLRSARRPTFVTINVQDFWRRLDADPKFMVACFALADSQAELIPPLLRQLFAQERFRTRRQRLGVIARISVREIRFYTVKSWKVQKIMLNR